MTGQLWQPTASIQNLKARAQLYSLIRDFFAQRKVMEVETPLLASAIGTDLNLSPFELSADKRQMFLQTSPEFAMKRLLASGSGAIFQICKAFRRGEAGSKHNPEFTMLEWYRPAMSMQALMSELEDLVTSALYPSGRLHKFKRISYGELFQQALGINPHAISLAEIKRLAQQNLAVEFSSDNLDTWLDFLFSHVIEPELQTPTFIYHYPKTQAALAKITKDDNGDEVAQRFELVCQGMELANGYFELTDAKEQARRFEHEQSLRQQAGFATFPLDSQLLAALEYGLPECSGVALGVDRLLMLMLGSTTIDEVIAFPIERA